MGLRAVGQLRLASGMARRLRLGPRANLGPAPSMGRRYRLGPRADLASSPGMGPASRIGHLVVMRMRRPGQGAASRQQKLEFPGSG
jgi:hypothetical protein